MRTSGYVLNLLIAQRVSLNRIQKSIKTPISRAMAEATILEYVIQLNDALAPREKAAILQLLALPAMPVDETSLRVEKKASLGPCLLRRRDHLEIPASRTGLRGDRRHRRESALQRRGDP